MPLLIGRSTMEMLWGLNVPYMQAFDIWQSHKCVWERER